MPTLGLAVSPTVAVSLFNQVGFGVQGQVLEN